MKTAHEGRFSFLPTLTVCNLMGTHCQNLVLTSVLVVTPMRSSEFELIVDYGLVTRYAIDNEAIKFIHTHNIQ